MVKGREVIEALAGRFPQLYVAPEEGAQEAHQVAERVGEFAAETHRALQRIEASCGDAESADPFGYLVRLKRCPLIRF